MLRVPQAWVLGIGGTVLCLLIYGGWRLLGPGNELRADRRLDYKTVDGLALTMHMFDARASGPNDRAPAFLFFHGGAWQYGDPRQFFDQCRFLADRGVTCFSVQYRIASVHGTDARAAVQDARSALQYVREHADALKIDADRVVAGGGSSGGHLAAALGVGLPLPVAAEGAGMRDRPAALVLYNPMLDLAPGMPDHDLVSAFWYEVSPLQHVDVRTPPTLILSGTEDREVSVETVRRFCSAVRVGGARCELALYAGAQHGFFNPGVDRGRYYDATNQRVVRFLQELGYPVSAPIGD